MLKAEQEGRIAITNEEARYSDSIEIIDIDQGISNKVLITNVQEEEAKINNNLSVKDFIEVFRSAGWIIFNISFCHFLKFLGIVSFADKATKMIKNGDSSHKLYFWEDYIKQEGFVILTLSFHIGSFLGKSLLTVYIFKQFSLTTLTLTSIVVFYGVAVY